MDSSLPGQPTNIPPAQTPTPHRNRAIFFFLGGIIILALIILAATFWFKRSQPSQAPEITNIPTFTNGLEVAEKIASFLDKAAKPDYSAHFAYICQNNVCSKKDEAGTTSHFNYIILFYDDLYKKTSNSKYKDIADASMSYWLNKCQTDTDKAICRTNIIAFARYYENTKDQKYRDAMLAGSDVLLQEGTLEQEMSVHNTRKLTTLYQVTGDKKYLDQAEKMAKRFIVGEFDKDDLNPVLYREGNFPVREYTFDTVTFEYLPLYIATKDPIYLKASEQILDKANIAKHLDLRQGPLVLAYMVEALLELEAVKDDKSNGYSNQAKTIAQGFINRFWDIPEKKKYDGDYGFLVPSVYQPQFKDPVMNEILGRQFLKMADEKFSLLQLQ